VEHDEDSKDDEDGKVGKYAEDGKGDQEDQDGQKLPTLTTNLYNYFILGVSLLVAGGLIVLISRRRKINN